VSVFASMDCKICRVSQCKFIIADNDGIHLKSDRGVRGGQSQLFIVQALAVDVVRPNRKIGQERLDISADRYGYVELPRELLVWLGPFVPRGL
jgi:hypothetical protein